MKPANIAQRTTTGTITAAGAYLRSVVLTSGSDASSVVVRAGGASGTTLLTLKAAADTSVSCGDLGADAVCAGGIHVTLTGTSPAVTVVWM